MFKENKETLMVVLIVLFIVFSVLSWFRILPGNLAESGMYGNIINHVQLQRSKDWQNCDELS